MQYLGNSAQVPLGDSKWSCFIPIPEAEKFEHNLKVQRFLNMLSTVRRNYAASCSSGGVSNLARSLVLVYVHLIGLGCVLSSAK